MSIQRSDVLRLVQAADHPLGVREILKQGGFNPGQQTDLKRVLREMVRQGVLEKVGKRYEPPGGIQRPAPGSEPERPRAAGVSRRSPPARPAAATRQGAARGVEPRAPRGASRGRVPDSQTERTRGPTDRPRGGRPTQGGRGTAAQGRSRPRTASRAPKQGDQEREAYLDTVRALDDVVEGILHVHRDGFGFVHPLHPEGDDENIYLPHEETARALDGDRVLVQVVQGRSGRTAGVLLEVVGRVRTRAVGVYQQEGRQAWVEPTDTSLRGNIRVPPTQLARPGDLVKVILGIGASVLERGDDLFGEVIGSIGKPGEPSGEVLSVAYGQGFSDEFPDEVMAEADRYQPKVSEEEALEEGRRDLRTLPLITIDGEDARDFDDAVHAEPEAGGWRLVVAIADVSHYVREGMALDVEALHRGTSVYLPDRVLPMLPERLSNGICSLRPDEDRLCMVADMRFDARAQLGRFEIYPGVMRSTARCTYNEVQDVLDGKDVPHRNALKPQFENLMTLARALNKKRRARGAIDFDLPEYKVILDDEGMPVRLDKRERKDSHRLVEECMLAANEAVAQFFQERELPSVYRFHGEPDEEKLEMFAQLARAHGFELKSAGEISSTDLNRFLEALTGHPERRALNHLLLRAMMQAVYSAENVGHYGLGAEHYLHFTSPIRRYPDLLVHRLLKQHWARNERVPSKSDREAQEEQLEALAVQSSDRERAAVAVEREVISYYQTLLMKDRVGETFAATVTSVTDFGFFVQLDEWHVEGLVKGESYGPDYELDARQHALVWPNGKRVKVGEAATVTLISANVARRQLEFGPADADIEDADAQDEVDAPAHRGRRLPARGRAAPPAPPGQHWKKRADRTARPAPPPLPAAPPPRTERPQRSPGLRPTAEEVTSAPSASPHPGFDRLRALAAQRGGRAGAGGSGRSEPRGGGTRRGARSETPARADRGGGEGFVARDKFGNPKPPRGGPRGGKGGGKKGKGGSGKGGGGGRSASKRRR